MGGIFGGGSSSAFGSRGGNILTRTTGILAAIFMVTAVSLAFLYKTPDTGDVARAARAAQTATPDWTTEAPETSLEAPAGEAPVTETPAVPVEKPAN